MKECIFSHLEIGQTVNMTGRITCEKCRLMQGPFVRKATYLGHINGESVFEQTQSIIECIECAHVLKYSFDSTCCDQGGIAQIFSEPLVTTSVESN